MRAVLISVGDELALGQTVDTNAAHLAAALAQRGIMASLHLTVPDDRAAIAHAIASAARQAPWVIVTGGLGPTADDLTRDALADAMAAPLVEDPGSLQALEAFFHRRNRPMPPANRVQALHPQGSVTIDNSCGTAPGITARLADATIFLLPGVPREMQVMFQRSVLPKLPGDARFHTATLHTLGLGESVVGQKLQDLMARDRDPVVGTTVANGLCSVRVRAPSAQALEETVAQVRDRLGAICFGRDDQTLAGSLVQSLRENRRTLATAESCTGGWIGKLVTDVPGCSEVYRGGWISYDNAMKQASLGVEAAALREHGAVSGPVALAMARGAAERGGADCAVSATGIAGPGGGTADKPVGTVWIGLHLPGESRAVCWRFVGEREQIRMRAAMMAVQLLRLRLRGEPIESLDGLMPPAEMARA